VSKEITYSLIFTLPDSETRVYCEGFGARKSDYQARKDELGKKGARFYRTIRPLLDRPRQFLVTNSWKASSPIKTQQQPKEPAKKYACRICRQGGHNAVTCPKRKPSQKRAQVKSPLMKMRGAFPIPLKIRKLSHLRSK